MPTTQFTIDTTNLGPLAANQNIYAFVYAGTSPYTLSNGTNYITLASAGNLTGTNTFTVNDGQGVSNVYIVNQFGGNASQFTGASYINAPGNYINGNYNYMLFETALANISTDQADISSLNNFSYTASMGVGTSTTNNVYSLGFKNSASNIFASTNANNASSASYLNGVNTNPQMFAIGPNQGVESGTGSYPSTNWQSYVTGLENSLTNLHDMQISGSFNGGTGIGLLQDAALQNYTVTYNASYHGLTNVFVFTPEFVGMPGAASAIIAIGAADVAPNIQTNGSGGSGNAFVSTNGGQTWASEGLSTNDQVGALTRWFFAGLDAGLWGSSSTSPGVGISKTNVDLNKTWNWQWYDEFGGTTASKSAALAGNVTVTNSIAAANGQTFGPGTSSGTSTYWDGYAQTIAVNSDTYGFPYSDLLTLGGTNPQISTYNPQTKASYSNINIALYGNDFNPTTSATSGYTPAPISYVAPHSGGYTAETVVKTSNSITTDFLFNTGGVNYGINSNWNFNLRIYDPAGTYKTASGSIVAPDANGYLNINLNSSTSHSTGLSGPFNNFTFTSKGSELSLSADAVYAGSGFIINGLPVTADGTASPYQILISDPTNSYVLATYNQYIQSSVSGDITNVYADPTTEVTPLINGTMLSFASGGTPTYNSLGYFDPNVLYVSTLYQLLLARVSDSGGLPYWVTQAQAAQGNPTALINIANSIIVTPEGQNDLGGLNNAQYVSYLYTHGLNRSAAADPGGAAFWTAQLDAGMSRGAVAYSFAESQEMWHLDVTGIASSNAEVVTKANLWGPIV